MDEEPENGLIIEDDDFFQDDFFEVMEKTEEAQESIASTSGVAIVPVANTQVIGPSQDFFQTLNGQVPS